MAKHPKSRRRRGKYIRGSVDEFLSLGTLAGKVVISEIFDETVNERSLISSIVATWTLRNYSKATDDGPVMVGVAHSDYSSAEIEEVLENTGSWSEGSKIEQETSKRLVRVIGTFAPMPVDVNDAAGLNDGKPIKTKLNWIVNQGQSLQVWAYNLGSGALGASPIVSVNGHANIWPR